MRTRVRDDAARLVADVGVGEVTETREGDYRFRVHLPRDTWAQYVATAAASIDYPNFKTAVAERQGADRAHAYGEVWSVMYGLQERG